MLTCLPAAILTGGTSTGRSVNTYMFTLKPTKKCCSAVSRNSFRNLTYLCRTQAVTRMLHLGWRGNHSVMILNLLPNSKHSGCDGDVVWPVDVVE